MTEQLSHNFEVIMPLMGEGINEATLVRWLKKPGEKIAKDEPLLEVSTDKVDTEIPSPVSGVISQTLAEEGKTVAINSVLAIIQSADAGAATRSPTGSTTKTAANQNSGTAPKNMAPQRSGGAATSSPQSKNLSSALHKSVSHMGNAFASTSGTIKSSPLVRKMALELSIDLRHVVGTGLYGRITRRDIEEFRQSPQPRPITTPESHAPKGHASARLKTDVRPDGEYLDGVKVTRQSMSKMRQLIADHMVQSVATSPHVTTVFEVDVGHIVASRKNMSDAFLKCEGFKLTYTPYFIHAVVAAIREHPIVNSSIDGYDVLQKSDINIGCAVALDGGLIVPVIKGCQDLNLVGVAKKLNDLVIRARSKKLLPEDVRGGTFSITNPGIYGSIYSNPIINQPQVAILSLGAIVERPVFQKKEIVPAHLCMIGLTFDHRLIDGEAGAKFLATLKTLIESQPPQLY